MKTTIITMLLCTVAVCSQAQTKPVDSKPVTEQTIKFRPITVKEIDSLVVRLRFAMQVINDSDIKATERNSARDGIAWVLQLLGKAVVVEPKKGGDK